MSRPSRALASLAAGLALAAATGCGGGGPMVHEVASPASGAASDPAVATTPEGHVLLAWIGGDGHHTALNVARSEDGGDSWSAPVAITPPGEPIHPHGESSPRLAVAPGGAVVAVWSTSWPVQGREWPASNVRFARSDDGGRTWSAPVTLNDDAAGAPGSHSFHGVAFAGDSTLVVAWLDERAPHTTTASDSGADDASIYLAQSSDLGRTWRPNQARWGAVCPCCRVQLAGNESGDVVAAWRKHLPGQIRDIVVADVGGEPEPVHADGWRFAGCPHSGASVVLDPDGTRHVLWYTGAAGRSGVYYMKRRPDEETAAPVALASAAELMTAHVSLAMGRLGPIAAWDVTAENHRAISVSRLDGPRGMPSTVAIPGSDGGLYPHLATLSDGRAFVAWTRPDSVSSIGVAAVDWPR